MNISVSQSEVKKYAKMSKKVKTYLKISDGCVKMFENDIFHIIGNLTLDVCIKKKNKEFFDRYNSIRRHPLRQGSYKKMANIIDAANYLVRLYYYGNRQCTSAVIQKLLIISQMRYLKLNRTPLFKDSLWVKPSCFSVRFISNTYPDIIFNQDSRQKLIDDYSAAAEIELPDTSCFVSDELSSFFEILQELSHEEKKVINETFRAFGAFSGKCIGEYMKKMELHKQKKPLIDEVSTDELLEYIDNLSEDDKSNPILDFVCR